MIESGDSVKHLSNTIIEVLPMTVYEIENGKALCGSYTESGKFVGEWFNLNELIVITKGNTNGV